MRPIAVVLVSMSLVVAGCSQPGAAPTITATGSTATGSTAQAPEPSGFASPSIQPSTEARPSPSLATDSPMAEPPAASIAVKGGDAVAGQLGSFTWQNSGSDGPWLPGSPIRVGSGEPLTLSLADPVGVANWTVSRAPAGADGSGAIGMAEGTGEPVTFDAPPAGSWSVHVDVWFADNLGSAAYYWLMTVD
jgi:hypothetical protein